MGASSPTLGTISFKVDPKVGSFEISPRIRSSFADGERIGVVEAEIVIVSGLIISSYERIGAAVGSRIAIRVGPRGLLSDNIGTAVELGEVDVVLPTADVSLVKCWGYQKARTADCVNELGSSLFSQVID